MKPSKLTTQWLATGAALALALTNSHASYSSAGQGMQTVLSGTVDDGALYMSTAATWQNAPQSPAEAPGGYTIDPSFTMPSANDIVNGRLIMTIWGGTADYTANLNVQINGNSLVSGGLNFGSTSDANPSFSGTQSSVYGSGYGVWLVSLPINPAYLNTNGSANSVQINVTTPNSFDGRISQVSLLSVYQNATLNNKFQYAIAEGSGDIFGTPSSPQVNNRTVSLGGVSLSNPTSATLHAVYTYGDTGQNDWLYFNGTQLGGNDIAT